MVEANILIFILTAPLFFGILLLTDRKIALKYSQRVVSIRQSMLITAGFIMASTPVLFLPSQPIDLVFIAGYISLLAVISVMDWRYKIIPNFLLAIILLLLICTWVIESHFHYDRVLLAVGTSLLLFALRARVLKHKGKIAIGYGDIKLLFIIALLTDPFLFALVIWIASAGGLIYAIVKKLAFGKSYDETIPFGSFLAGTLMFILLTPYPERIVLYLAL